MRNCFLFVLSIVVISSPNFLIRVVNVHKYDNENI